MISHSHQQHLRDLSYQQLMLQSHYDYLVKLKNQGVEPKVIYDIGACVLHWTSCAKYVWPNSTYVAFDAMEDAEFLYKENNLPYYIGVLSDQDNKQVNFYQNVDQPGGNSYYKENKDFNPSADVIFSDQHCVEKTTITLDSIVKIKKFPLPDIIKMDVQGAELDILKGAQETLKHCRHLILELQEQEYNIGAPLKDEVIKYLDSIGFELKTASFSQLEIQGDYHFVRKTQMSQRMYFYQEELWGRQEVLSYVRNLKQSNPNFTLIDLGASWNHFSTEFLTHTFDLNPHAIPNVKAFSGDLNDYEDWVQLFDYVKENGKFDFANCTHTLEDIAYPIAALKYLPRIAKEGFIAVPSKYWELERRDLMRGGHHHRWIFDIADDTLLAYPKINLIEYMTIYDNMQDKILENSKLELRIWWRDNINFAVINNDYLGPTFQDVINMYHGLMY